LTTGRSDAEDLPVLPSRAGSDPEEDHVGEDSVPVLLEVDVSPRGSSSSLMGAEPREPVEGPDDVAESGWLL
jgi:hypothetical protein